MKKPRATRTSITGLRVFLRRFPRFRSLLSAQPRPSRPQWGRGSISDSGVTPCRNDGRHGPEIRLWEHALVITAPFFPVVALAAAPATFVELVELVVAFLQRMFALLIMATAVGVIFGVFMYFFNADDEKKREQIKGYLLWAVVGLFVLASIWGILSVLTDTFWGGGLGIPLIRRPV